MLLFKFLAMYCPKQCNRCKCYPLMGIRIGQKIRNHMDDFTRGHKYFEHSLTLWLQGMGKKEDVDMTLNFMLLFDIFFVII